MADEPLVLVEQDGAVATVRINRPQVLNTLNDVALTALRDAFLALAQSVTVRAIILAGAGERAFAAGADIKAMRDYTSAQGRAFALLGQATTSAVANAPQPVIAAVRGFALGGGCELALACDFRIAADDAVFAQPEVSLGIPPGWGGTQRLPRLIGPGGASDLIFTGRRVRADEALRLGLVGRVVPADALMDAARETARAIAANAPLAVQGAKRAIARATDADFAAGLAFEAEMFAAAFATADQREGMTAFIEKRTPSFTGE